MIRRLVVAVILLAVGISAQADVPDLVTQWEGFSSGMNQTGAGSYLTITAQRRHHFEGVLYVGASGGIWKTNGIVNQQGVINLTGVDSSGNTLNAHGRVIQFAFGDGSVHLMSAMYRVNDANGNPLDEGIWLLAQMFGGIHWGDGSVQFGDVGGTWTGELEGLTKVGPGRLDLPTTNGISAFMGAASFFDVNFEIQGSVGADSVTDGTSNTIMIGVGQNGIIAILIGLLVPAVQDQPAMLVGRYIEYENMFGVFAELVHGKNTSIDHGSYKLRRRRR